MVSSGASPAPIIRPAFGAPPAERARPATLSLVPAAGVGAPHGRPRSVGVSMLLFAATLGIYGALWAFVVHRELRAETSRGPGGWGGLALWLLAFPVLMFSLPAQVAGARHADGLPCAVRAGTGLWMLLPLVGPLVWFVKVQRALNQYWWDR